MDREEILPRNCFAIVQLKSDTDIPRVRECVPEIIDMLKGVAIGDMEQVCRSNDGTLFGFFLRTAKALAIIRANFERCGGTRNGDSILIFEVGEDFNGLGFSRAWTWLQHH